MSFAIPFVFLNFNTVNWNCPNTFTAINESGDLIRNIELCDNLAKPQNLFVAI